MAKSQEELLQELIDLQKNRPSGTTTSSAPPTSGGFSAGGIFESATTAVGKFAKGTFTASDALGVFNSVIAKVPGVGEGLSKVTSMVGEGAINLNKSLNESGKVGANFNNNLGEFQKGLSGARMTAEQWNDVIKNNSTAINYMGGDVNKASKNFMGLAKDLQESGVARQLQESGVGVEEFTQQLMTQAANRRSFDINDERQRKELIATTLSLNAELDATARLTGKSREAMQGEINKQNQKAEMVAATMQMDEKQRQAYDATRKTMAGFGASTQNLITEMASGGVRTKEGMNALAALGPAGGQLQSAMNQMKNARTPLEKAEAEAALTRARTAVVEYQRSKSYLDMVRMDNSEVGQQRRQQFMENQGMINAQIGQQKDLQAQTGKNVSAQEAENAKRKEIANSQAGVNAQGQRDTGAAAGRAINQANIVAKDMTAGLGIKIDATNKIAGQQLVEATGANSKLGQMLQYRTAEQANKAIGDVGGAVGGLVGGKKGASGEASNKPAGFNGVVPVQKEFGSLGTVGKLIEDFGKGTPAMLHGKEGVVTESQMSGIIGQATKGGMSMASSGINGMVSQIAGMKNSMMLGLGEKQAAATAAPTALPEFSQSQPAEAAGGGGGGATITDLRDLLEGLNKRMEQLIAHTADAVDTASKQVRATKSLSNNRMTA